MINVTYFAEHHVPITEWFSLNLISYTVRCMYCSSQCCCFYLVNTKVEVRFHVSSATWISDDIKGKVIEQVMPFDLCNWTLMLSCFAGN